jgi:hypothetical protein
MFRAIYDSPWHNPAAFWAAGLAFLAWWMRRKPFLTAFVALFTVEILADALSSGAWSPVTLLHSPAEQPLSIAFVILGDWRYFLVAERYARSPSARPGDATAPAAWASSIALSFVVPIASAIANRHLPAGLAADVRWTFLVYEILFFLLAIALRFAVYPRRLAAAPAPVRAWILRVTTFEIVQYALWALSDVTILAGVDAGFALRLVPDGMYYMLFLPFVALTAPAEVDA